MVQALDAQGITLPRAFLHRDRDTVFPWSNIITTGDDAAELTPLDIPESAVPDVRGMGLRDALYLLENAGLRVNYDGIGTVKSQSIAPGTPLRTELTTIQLRLS